MRLFTHHPSTFNLSDPNQRIDWTKGTYWRYDAKGFRYKEVLPILLERLGDDQFLWCCSRRATYPRTGESIDLVEWEINLPLSEIVLISSPAWEGIVHSENDDWDSLILTGLTESEAASDDVCALVRFPVRPEALTCHGQLPARYLAGGENPAYKHFVKTGER